MSRYRDRAWISSPGPSQTRLSADEKSAAYQRDDARLTTSVKTRVVSRPHESSTERSPGSPQSRDKLRRRAIHCGEFPSAHFPPRASGRSFPRPGAHLPLLAPMPVTEAPSPQPVELEHPPFTRNRDRQAAKCRADYRPNDEKHRSPPCR